MSLAHSPPKKAISDSNLCESSSAEHENVNVSRLKRKRPDDMQGIISEMRCMFDNFVSNQESKFASLHSALSDIKSQNETISNSMDMLSSKYDEMQLQMQEMKKEREEHLRYINILETKIESLERSNCSAKVEIRNIPKAPNESKEDLVHMVTTIGKALNISLEKSDIRDIYRGYSKAIVKPIILEFTSVITKETLVKSVKKFNASNKTNKLNTQHLKMSGPVTPIYISECLTAKGKRLFYLAKDFATSHNFAFCWSSYGKIYIRQKEGSPHYRIDCEADLIKIKSNLL